MGKRSEERGELILPSRAVLDVRNALVEAENQTRAQALEMAQQIHAYLRSDAGAEDRRALSSLLRRKPAGGYHSVGDLIGKQIEQRLGPVRQGSRLYDEGNGAYSDRFNFKWMVEQLLIKRAASRDENDKLQSPKKKDLPALLASKTWSWSNSECSINLDPKTRKLSWYVDYAKNAVEDAWSSQLGRTLKSALAKVEWTRGTGGAFNYSDEYMRDSSMDHGTSGTSMSLRFGPLGDAEFKARNGYLPPKSGRRPGF